MHVDLISALTSPDRDAALERLCAGSAVKTATYFDGTPIHLVSGYEEVMQVLTDPRFSNDVHKQTKLDLSGAAGLPEDVRPYFMAALGAQDPPDHTRLRRLVSREFTFRRVERLRPRIRQIADELLDALPQETDIVADLAYPLPIRVICELLGVPLEDRERWQQWSRGMGGPDLETVAAGSRGLVAYIRELIAAKRANPGEDLLSALVAHDELTEGEIASLALSILLAGHETTVAVISAGVLLLLTRPEQRERLAAAPDGVADAVEEFLRYNGAADVGVFRFTLEPVELGGVTIPAGEPVMPLYFGANRDPRTFSQPSELRLDRGRSDHLGFGHGIHYCLGAALARAELQIVFTELLRRFPDLALAHPEAPPTWRPGPARTLDSLPVRLF
ncbi:cytochrome P450 family protein [Streptomonospora litoralis]|uniref:Cytochrome P450 107B1 n=1 Tax=Streptomonospora litoralis TaxID=2498135 RepID=A0A4P6Q0U8_9ACTN|nr:cytochrome P450 [Streptomonospora litoralis]QBI54063.1 Cytochrome P450 107B1 [Streptomonospora litoralis]